MIVLELGGTLSSCPAVHLNCIKNPLYHGACVSIFDRWCIYLIVFEECPLGAGSSLAHVFHLSIVYFHCSGIDVSLSVMLCFFVLGYIIRLLYFIWNCFCLHVRLICALSHYFT